KPGNLVWTPYVMGRSDHAMLDDAPMQTIAPREGDDDEDDAIVCMGASSSMAWSLLPITYGEEVTMPCSTMHPCKLLRRGRETMMKMTQNPAKTRNSLVRHLRRLSMVSARIAVYVRKSQQLVRKAG